MNTHLAVEAVNGSWQVVAMVDDVVAPVLFDDAVMARPVNGAVGIGLKDTAFVLEGSHRAYGGRGILHAVGMVVAGA